MIFMYQLFNGGVDVNPDFFFLARQRRYHSGPPVQGPKASGRMQGEEIGIFGAGREQLECTPRTRGLLVLLGILQEASGCPLGTYLVRYARYLRSKAR